MRIFYDTEFVERGPEYPIELVSIGMVREDGAEYYAVSANVSAVAQHHAAHHEWLGPNVWAQLPTVMASRDINDEWASIDSDHPDVKQRTQIAEEVHAFCTEGLELDTDAELWAYYAAYDHVVLAQLFGLMIDLPKGMPMFTLDIKQEMERNAISSKALPVQESGEHNALEDARWSKLAWEYVRDEA